MTLKGSMCNCGFATVTDRTACPRCGRPTFPMEWADTGKVLSYSRLELASDGGAEPAGLALVEMNGKGPKIVCWSPDRLSPGDYVDVRKDTATTYSCSKRRDG